MYDKTQKKKTAIISATNPDTGESIEYELDTIDFTIQYNSNNTYLSLKDDDKEID